MVTNKSPEKKHVEYHKDGSVWAKATDRERTVAASAASIFFMGYRVMKSVPTNCSINVDNEQFY